MSAHPPHWVIIHNWPGLEAIYLVKLTRRIPLDTLQQQFRTHLSPCPTMMDRVLFSMQQKKISCRAREYIKSLIVKMLDSPEAYSCSDVASFETFCIEQYCSQLADCFFSEMQQNPVLVQQWKCIALQKWRVKRDKRIICEEYLCLTFPEDFERSSNEIKLVLEKTKWRALI